MNYDNAIAWLYSTQGAGIKLGLTTIRRLLSELGVDQTLSRPGPHRPAILHVAGTNGKGSVCAMLDSICREAGLRTGLFTSPHLVTFRERIKLNGVNISEADTATGLTRIRDLIADWDFRPTFFELTTALALAWFQQQEVEAIVLETGLGGRLDSTNAVTPGATILTSISFDHWQFLGNTLREIAGEKAGILKADVPAVSGPQLPEAADVLREAAYDVGAPLEWITEPAPFEVALAGSHQKLNAAIAIAGLKAARIPIPDGAIERGLRNVVWPGRFQRIEHPRLETGSDSETRRFAAPMVLDGAHNEAAAVRLVQTWRELHGAEKPVIVLGVLRDKDVAAICRALAPLAAVFIVTPVHSVRSATTESLALIAREYAPGTPCLAADSVDHALALAQAEAQATDRRILVTGSLFLVGETLSLLAGDKPDRSAQ